MTPAEKRTRDLLATSPEAKALFEQYHELLLREVERQLRHRPKKDSKQGDVALSVLLSYFGNHVETAELPRLQGAVSELLQDITRRHCEKWNRRYRAGKRRPRGSVLPIGVSTEGPDGAPQPGFDVTDSGPTAEELASAADEVIFILEELPRRLSKRQREILGLKHQGCQLQEIAARIGASPRTVSAEWAQIRHRAGALGHGGAAVE
jgi:DNA-binding CsgD family transcriptional regulator